MRFTAPDPTFYPSPRLAMEGPREKLGYVVALAADGGSPSGNPDALAVVDLDPESSEYGRIVHWLAVPSVGDEFHHFGWNACSSALCPYAPHPHLERGAISSSPGSARPGSTSSIRDPIRAGPRSSSGSSRKSSSAGRATRGLTPSTAGRRASTSAPSAMPRGTARAAFSSWTISRSSLSAAGKSIGVPSFSPTTSGGISARTF